MAIPWEILGAYALGFIILYLAGRLLMVPGRWIWRLVLNSLVGAFIMWLINAFSSITGFGVTINPLSVLLTSAMGIPGVALVVGLTMLFA